MEERQNKGDGGMEVKTWRAPSRILQEVQRSRECFETAGLERVHIGTLVLLGCIREVEVERGPSQKKNCTTADAVTGLNGRRRIPRSP